MYYFLYSAFPGNIYSIADAHLLMIIVVFLVCQNFFLRHALDCYNSFFDYNNTIVQKNNTP